MRDEFYDRDDSEKSDELWFFDLQRKVVSIVRQPLW